jgi:hypothetical protein
MVDRIESEDYYKRQVRAFRMAFSNIPRELQVILYEVGSGVSMEELARTLGKNADEISRERNYGISLILHKIMRGKHLTEDEKEEILKLHSIVPESDGDEDDEEWLV